tara:strand:- start:16904 stop:18415 length:1512 start_codon:yes stop_codon:yes gene_type:complete
MAIQISGAQIKDLAVSTAKLAGSIPASKLDLTGTYDYRSATLLVATPSADSHPATKAYVDSVQQGAFWKDAVDAATTANIDLSDAPSSIDGVTLSANDRILVKNQSTASQNGVYVFASAGASMARSSDLDAGSEFPSAAVFVKAGTTNADQGYICTNDSAPNLGSDAITFTQFTGLSSITAGDALTKTGDRLDVQVDDSSIEIASDALQIKALGITDGMLAGSISNSKLANSTISGVALGTNLNSLQKATNGGVTFSNYNGSAAVSNVKLDITDLADGSVDLTADFFAFADATDGNSKTEAIADLVAAMAGDALEQDGSSKALKAKVDDSSIEIASDALQIKASGVTNAMLAGSIGQDKLAGSIPDSKLNQLTTANKVAGSAVQLGSNGAIQNDSGIKVAVDDATIDINSNAVRLAIAPSFQAFTPNNSNVNFDLSETVVANFDVLLVIKNGLILKQVASSPADSDEYTVSRTGGSGGVTRISFGAAPLDTDDLRCMFFSSLS